MERGVLELLLEIKKNNVDPEFLDPVIRKSISISFSYLNYRKKQKYYNLGDDFESLNDIAVDAVIPLFVKGKNGKIGLFNSLKKWDKKLVTEYDAEFFLNRIVWKRVEQTISNVLKVKDPFFAKILDTINTCLRKYNFSKIALYGEIYIIKSEVNHLDKSLITIEEFNKIPGELFLKKQASLINALLKYIKKHTEYYPAIPLNLMINRIKHINLNNDIYFSANVNPATQEKIIVKENLKFAHESLTLNLKKKYLEKNKLNFEEVKAFERAFKSISIDLQNGGTKDGLYTYLKNEMPELESEIFYTRYHGIMHYLYQDFKNEIINNWEY